MRVLVLEPGFCPYIAIFASADDAVRRVIKGKPVIETPFENEVIALVRSEEQETLPYNRTISEDSAVYGRALICGYDGQNLRELTKKQADRYYRRYLYPEKLQDNETGLCMIPQQPRVKPKDERLGRKPTFLER